MQLKCAWLENYLLIDTDSFTRPCCGETFTPSQISNISNGILNSFNDPKLLSLRENIKQGFSETTRKYCRRCEISEKTTNSSLRLGTPFLSDKRELKKIQFKLSNKCQLACAHCGPNYSSTWAKLLKIKPHVISNPIITENFLTELDSIFENIEYLKFTGGEPFLDPNHWKILKYLKHKNKSHCTLEYITNGLTDPNYELWEGWKEIKCTVSIDGFKDTYEWFRRGSSWDQVNKNIEKLRKISNVTISFSLTPYTIQDYFKAKLYFKDFYFYTNQIILPVHCNFSLFPTDILTKLENIENIPYALETSNKAGNINFYRSWAKKWDLMWNTTGTAEKLFFWF